MKHVTITVAALLATLLMLRAPLYVYAQSDNGDQQASPGDRGSDVDTGQNGADADTGQNGDEDNPDDQAAGGQGEGDQNDQSDQSDQSDQNDNNQSNSDSGTGDSNSSNQ